ncbi:MAG: alpha/beta hydrolase [Candidatus Contendobacter sp.]|nr:alpha/beta hydrolase [Candidatus Contendobacter sp.]
MRTKTRYLLLVLILLLLGPSGYGRADHPSSDCNITSHEVALDGGVLYYNTAGTTGPRVLLLHGLFAQKEQWNGVLCLLSSAGYAAMAPDLPGYGQSIDFPLVDYRLENQVERLRQFVDALGIATFDLAGSSMGGAIAALYVRHYPRQVRTLAFIGSPLGIVGWGPRVREAIYQGINPFIPIDIAQFDLEMGLLFVNPPSIPEPVKAALVKDYVERNRHYQQVWDIVNLYDTMLEDGPPIWIPTLVLWGADDRIFAVEGLDRLSYRFPRGKRVKLPGTGHLPLLENPEATTGIYLDFLRTYPAGRLGRR